eukprot:6188161-Pleurochrysis_carterae.AAC.1
MLRPLAMRPQSSTLTIHTNSRASRYIAWPQLRVRAVSIAARFDDVWTYIVTRHNVTQRCPDCPL